MRRRQSLQTLFKTNKSTDFLQSCLMQESPIHSVSHTEIIKFLEQTLSNCLHKESRYNNKRSFEVFHSKNTSCKTLNSKPCLLCLAAEPRAQTLPPPPRDNSLHTCQYSYHVSDHLFPLSRII